MRGGFINFDVLGRGMAGLAAVDWTTVISTAITGAVGLAGIGGALLSARMTSKSDAENLKMSIAAEDEHARLAEKRRAS